MLDAATLRGNIDTLRIYAETEEQRAATEEDNAAGSFNRGRAAAYGDMARKLAVAEHVEIDMCARCGIAPVYHDYEWCAECRPELRT